jgi:hypothetical protein
MSAVFDMMRDVPAHLAVAWGGWLAVGLTLLLWHLRARDWEREYARLIAHPATRTKPGVRLASGVRRAAKAPAADPFADLEAMLEPAPTTGSLSRRPGD